MNNKNINRGDAGIDHIEFWVSNLENSIKFYTELFKLINWHQTDDNGFGDGKTKIYFIEKPFSARKTAGPRHICFYADSKETVDKVGEFLKQNKSPIIRGPVNSIWKSSHSYTVDFQDPDGYVLEVTKALSDKIL